MSRIGHHTIMWMAVIASNVSKTACTVLLA
jgi:hypothetical protein